MTDNSKLQVAWKNNTHPQWYRDPGLRKNCILVAFMYLGTYSLGYDSALFTGLLSMPQWNEYFDAPSGKRLGLIMASMCIPQIIAYPAGAWFSDRLGRKKATCIGCSGIVVGAFIGCFARNEGMLIAGRVVVGSFTAIVLVSTTCWINELLHPRMRGIASALQSDTYYVGAIISSWCTFGTLYWTGSEWSWRLPTLLQGLGPLVLLVAAFFCPESPRWLVSQGRKEEAWSIFARYHANGDKDDELVRGELEEVIHTIRKEKEVSESWRSLVKTRGNRKRMLILTIIASGPAGNGVLIIASLLPPILRLVGIQDPKEINAISGGLAIFNWLACIAGSLFVDKLGRRPLWLLSTGSMLVAYVIITALAAAFTHTPDKAIGEAFIAVLFLYYGSYSIAWTPLPYLYSAEILPFSIRAKAMAYSGAVSNILLTISVYVNPIILEAIGWKFYGFFVASLAVYLFLEWLLFIETRGRTIEQVSALFEDTRRSARHSEDKHLEKENSGD
ncbi:hypothetical protein V5O48_003052 [Marasmius crinis-equi]|uniref:Major facilitator superfamily (MFS) profile domain-containing protein n=1 Tax=Marasmius crinis-equi TaxID=585013 RepID=A0ABR3FUH0_9AGAR